MGQRGDGAGHLWSRAGSRGVLSRTSPFNPLPSVLDRATGFEIGFTSLVQSESHTSVNRAGFSIVAISNDLKGIELGFWTNQISAQEVGFTFAENVGFDTTSFKNYALQISGNNYNLLANGSSILTGTLRDYSGFGFPYNQANFLFLGDDTTSAQGVSKISSVSLIAPIPEPTSGVVLVAGFIGLLSTRRRRGVLRA